MIRKFLAFPGWFLYRIGKFTLPATHPWVIKPIPYLEWCRGATPTTLGFGLYMWLNVPIIIYFSYFLATHQS